MAKKTLLTASPIQSVEPYSQNISISNKRNSLVQSDLVVELPNSTQNTNTDKESKLLLPSKESSSEVVQDILIDDKGGEGIITDIPKDVEIIYVPNIQIPTTVKIEKKNGLPGDFIVTPKPFIPCDSPSVCNITPQYQNTTPGYNVPAATPSTITIIDSTKANVKWHPEGVIFSGNPEKAMSIIYTSGKIFIHEWYILSEAEITELGTENYHPERRWEVLGNIEGLSPEIILSDKEIHYIFAKVPISEDLTTAEIVITKEYGFEGKYEGYIYILMGVISYIEDLLILSMLWGDDTKLVKVYPPIETREIIDDEECLKVNDANTGIKRTYYHTETKDPKTLQWVSNNDDNTRDSADYTMCPIPKINTREVIDNEECVKVNGVNVGLKRTYYHTETQNPTTLVWTSNNDDKTRDYSDYTTCPTPIIPGVITRETRDSSKDYCELNDGMNTGTRFLYLFEETKTGDGPWIPTVPTKFRYTTEYNTTECPLVPYRVSMSTGPSGGYNFSNEKNIVYSPGEFVSLEAPIYHDEDDWDFFYLSVPSNKNFIVTDSIGNNIRSEFSSVGSDNRTGFRNNTVYMKADAYATDFVGMFNLKIN